MASERPTRFSPTETRLMHALLAAPENEVRIDVLFDALQSGALPGTRRVLQQIVGPYVYRINNKLARAGRPEVVKPGKGRFTYRLWPSLSALERWRRSGGAA